MGVVETGLTLQALAEAKSLPLQHFQAWGWRTQRGRDKSAKVFIPWYDLEGVKRSALATHVRHYINKDDGTGPRFTWDLPRHITLQIYGCWRISEWLEEAAIRGIQPYIWITESELDALTLWFHGIPALATGGAGNWRASWAESVGAFGRVYIAQEPGTAGREMVRRIGGDILGLPNPPEVIAVPFPEVAKDANALHRAGGGDTRQFCQSLLKLIDGAVPASEVVSQAEAEALEAERIEREAERQGLIEAAGTLLTDPRLLHEAICAVEALGLVGERRNIGILHLKVLVKVHIIHRARSRSSGRCWADRSHFSSTRCRSSNNSSSRRRIHSVHRRSRSDTPNGLRTASRNSAFSGWTGELRVCLNRSKRSRDPVGASTAEVANSSTVWESR